MPLIKFVDNNGREMALMETLMSREELESEYQNFLKEKGGEFGLDTFIRYLSEKNAPIISVHQLPVDHTMQWDLASEQTG